MIHHRNLGGLGHNFDLSVNDWLFNLVS
jgi:hypothetical protein